jgi:murein L,D-transpeptidase YafK
MKLIRIGCGSNSKPDLAGNPPANVICVQELGATLRTLPHKLARISASALILLVAQSVLAANEKYPAKITAPKKFNSVAAVLKEYGKPVRQKLTAVFQAQKIDYPPPAMTWICLKQERLLMLFAKDKAGQTRRVLSYPIIGASGVSGPKLKEGDMQVPEGFYKIAGFRPNLEAHMGLDVDYPNAADRAHAKEDRRRNLGSDILIHGSRWSTGCLAMGNEPIEEMFVLAHDAGIKNIALIFAPCDLTKNEADVDFAKQPKWLPKLYSDLRKAMNE